MFSCFTHRFHRAAIGGLFAIVCACACAHAGEIDLKSIESIKQDQGAKRKYGPYVGVMGGGIYGHEADVVVGGVGYPLNDFDNGSVYGIEVGYTWRDKKWPVSFSAEFEATFMSTELSGGLSAEETAAVLDVSTKTVIRDWTFAKAWLQTKLI